jgi:hypothetical protein
MNRYSNDPRMIKSKFGSNCSKCKVQIRKGTIVYYWPGSREIYCMTCGEGPFRQFLSSAADEEVYSGYGNPLA